MITSIVKWRVKTMPGFENHEWIERRNVDSVAAAVWSKKLFNMSLALSTESRPPSWELIKRDHPRPPHACHNDNVGLKLPALNFHCLHTPTLTQQWIYNQNKMHNRCTFHIVVYFSAEVQLTPWPFILSWKCQVVCPSHWKWEYFCTNISYFTY